MERLTYYDLDSLGYYKKGKRTGEGSRSMEYYEVLDKLGKYEDEEEQGLLLKLPCKIGASVWLINTLHFFTKEPIEKKVDRFIILDGEILLHCTDGNRISASRIGKTVFLSKEKAEEAISQL